MKIAHIITRMIIGGAQENTLLSVLGLQEDPEFEVDLITGRSIGPEGRLDLSKVKSVLFENSLIRNIHLIRDSICLIKLILLFKKNKYDVIHTHSSKAGVLGRIAARLAGVPVILHTVHGLPFHPYQNKYKNRFFITLEKFCSLFTDKIIVVADAMREKSLKEKIGRSEQYITIHSGMLLDNYLNVHKFRQQVRHNLKIRDDQVVIGKIARLFELKGHRYILSIAKDLIQKKPEIVFLWVGDGIFREKFQKQIKEMNMENHFIFTGLVPPEDICRYLSAMDILVHVSLREGLARVLPQAMAAGIPVISFDIDGAKEVIINSGTGFLIEPENVQELKKKIIQLINDQNLRETFIQNGKKKVDPLYRHDYMVKKLKEVYKEYLTKKIKR